jgi:ABC-type sugar transport system ATPase subunit
MASIVLENLSKAFDKVIAVDQVNLTIQDGEFFALLGPSGCGKTTTLRMIAGLEKPTSGTIRIGDQDITDRSPRERDVAMVFQDYALYPHMTIEENVGYPLKVRRVNRAERKQRVTEVSSKLGIGNLLERRPSQISGGQQQRAAVARAVVHHAQVFLFDEPLSNLDAKLRFESRGFLKHLQKELQITTVYVTHDQAEAMALADRIAIIDHGKIAQVGSPQEVYLRPQNVFVASFLGSPPMNLLPCKINLAKKQVIINGSQIDLIQVPQITGMKDLVTEGEELIMGIRPEHISLFTEETPQTFPAEWYVTQPLGSEVLITLQVGETSLSVQLFTDEPPVLPKRVWLKPDPKRILLYRAADGVIVA